MFATHSNHRRHGIKHYTYETLLVARFSLHLAPCNSRSKIYRQYTQYRGVSVVDACA